MKEVAKNSVILLVILLLAFFLQKKYIKDFPSHIHAWAQSDHYALAQGFTNNGFNFFKPETFVYNHQFPHAWMVPSDQTITAVDFPINNFVPAVLMKILGKKSPWIYKCYVLLYSLIGLFFLYKLASLAGNDFPRSTLIVMVAATSPLFVYYQSGFLPSIPSLANAVIGIFFYYSFLKTDTRKYFYLSLFFLTLAALCRTTFAIPLLAVIGLELLSMIKQKSMGRGKILPLLLSLAIVASYFLYNGFLRNKYGSIFLSRFLPPDNLDDAIAILRTIKSRWALTYFSGPQLIFFAGVIIASGYYLLVKKHSLSRVNKQLIFLTAVIFTGCFLFFILLMKQFPEHDYYFLDTFFLPIILACTVALSLVPQPTSKPTRVITWLSVLLIAVPMYLSALASQEQRRLTGTWDKTNETILNFKNSEDFLDSMQVSKQCKILVLDAAAPNIPFLLMQRKGFAVISTEPELIEKSLAWNYDYAIIQNQYFLSEIYASYPAVIDKLERIADNGKLSLCKKRDPADQSFVQQMNFEKDTETNWENILPLASAGAEGSRAGKLLPSQEFGITFKSKHLPQLRGRPCYLVFSSLFKINTLNDCELVVGLTENGKNVFYHNRNLKKFLKKQEGWQKLDFTFELPQIKSDNYELAVFLWNTGKSELVVDNFGFKIF